MRSYCYFCKKIRMKKFTILVLALASFAVNAQTISNNLSGYFQNSKKDALYSSIYLDGKGHAIISDSFSAEYFQKEDTLYVFPDKSVFIFKLEKGKLKGLSSWVEKNTFKQTTTPNEEEIASFDSSKIDPELLYEYYKLNYTDGTDEVSFYAFENEQDYLKKTEELCNKGLTSACGAYFGMLYIESSGGLSSILGENEEASFKENPKMEKIANKMISLNDMRGYSLLGSYYYALGNTDKAMELYNEGAEKGDYNSNLILMEQELNKMIDEYEETE